MSTKAISDLIAEFIESAMQVGGMLEFARGELADKFGCAPSQINYVISTRFTPEHGYLVESRRGGGGYIRIRRVYADAEALVIDTLALIGTETSQTVAKAVITNLLQSDVIGKKEARAMLGAVARSALEDCPEAVRDRVRASVLRQMIINVI